LERAVVKVIAATGLKLKYDEKMSVNLMLPSYPRNSIEPQFVEGCALSHSVNFLPMNDSVSSLRPDVIQLARLLAADFSNQAQAFENPPFFAHIRVAMRPLPIDLLQGISLFLEQAYDISMNRPYRLRILRLLPQDGYIEIENYQVSEEAEFYGAARNPAKLVELHPERLQKMVGCSHFAEAKGDGFHGYVQPGKQCIVHRNETETYLAGTFEVDERRFSSLDRGCDPRTDALVWGSVAGPFEFVRVQSFADEVPHLAGS
jgi:hypothetical protein